MVTLLDAFGLGFMLVVHSAIVALLTRFFRVRLHTRWGGALYALFISPVVLVVTTLFFSGVLALGPDLGSAAAVVAVVIGVPMAVGLTFDTSGCPPPRRSTSPRSGTARTTNGTAGNGCARRF